MLLSLLAHENDRLLVRQNEMYAADAPLWQRYEQACDFLEDDLASGYVRLLQEMIAAGWSDQVIAEQVTALLRAWFALLERVIEESSAELGNLGSLRARDLATLVGLAFMGGESMLLLDKGWGHTVLPALRAVAEALKHAPRTRKGITMTREVIHTASAPSSPFYSQGVRAGGQLIVSGMTGTDPATGALAGPGIQEQTRQAIANCLAVLSAGGGTPDDIVEVGILLLHPADFAGLNDEYARCFPVDPPARYVARLGVELPGVLVSIRMSASVLA